MNIDLERLLQQMHAAVDLGRQVLLDYFGDLSQIEEKDQAGLVSEADLVCEERMVRVLKSLRPEAEVLAEEASYRTHGNLTDLPRPKSEGVWILDPLDGTTNFIHRFWAFAISLAFEWRGEVVAGIVDLPRLGVRYWATQGGGAFRNGATIRVSETAGIGQALLATGFPPGPGELMDRQLEVFISCLRKSRGIRRVGAAAYDLCLVADGTFDAFWEFNLRPWDTAAGLLLVREAGGRVTDVSGGHYDPYSSSILATNQRIHPEILALAAQTSCQKYANPKV